jgi:hypothetical protein
MKTITGLNDKLKAVDVGDEIPQEVQDQQATFKKLFRLSLAGAKGTADRALEQYDLGAKLALAGDDASLEDAEYKLLKEVVRENPTQLIPYFLAQLLKKLP